MTDFRIRVLDGHESNFECPVGDVLSIGRMAENDLALSHASVSRRHARIIRRGGGLFIEDLESAHGTSVNGERVKTREIKSGDLIGIGPVSLRVVGDAADPAGDGTASDVLFVQSTTDHSRASLPLIQKSSTKDPAAQAARFEALLQIGLSLQGEREIRRLLERLARMLIDTMEVDRCGIFLRGKSEPEIVFSRSGAESADSLPFSRTILRRAMEQGLALVTADAGRDARLAGASLAAGSIRSAMVAPLSGRERVLGAVVVENRGKVGVFDAEDLRLLVVLANLAGTAIENVNLIDEVRRETEERAALSRFFSPTVAEEVRRRGLSEGLRGDRREITVLFTDIRGFTSLSETLPPDDLLESLNHALAAKTRALFAENGTIDKFTGDGVLAFFGAPIAQDDHAARAIRAARQILAACRNLKTRSGLALPVGIGIATGIASVGPVGSIGRMEYTVIGDVVNIAARLVAKACGGEILLTEETVKAAAMGGAQDVERLGEWRVRGRAGELQVCRLR